MVGKGKSPLINHNYNHINTNKMVVPTKAQTAAAHDILCKYAEQMGCEFRPHYYNNDTDTLHFSLRLDADCLLPTDSIPVIQGYNSTIRLSKFPITRSVATPSTANTSAPKIEQKIIGEFTAIVLEYRRGMTDAELTQFQNHIRKIFPIPSDTYPQP